MPDPDFDVDFTALPPKLQIQLWLLALDADTSRVNLAFQRGSFRTGLTYHYGGNLEASFRIRNVSTRIGVSPANGDVDLGLVYRGYRFGATGSVANQSGGVSFGYGAKLLPFPNELATTFNSAAVGLHSTIGDLSTAPDNPLTWYNLHSDDIDSISRAVSLGQQIYKQSGDADDFFGVGIRLNYSVERGLVVYGGAQFRF